LPGIFSILTRRNWTPQWKLTQRYPEDEDFSYALVVFLKNHGHEAEAIAEYERYSSVQDATSLGKKYLDSMAEAYASLGYFDKAEEIYFTLRENFGLGYASSIVFLYQDWGNDSKLVDFLLSLADPKEPNTSFVFASRALNQKSLDYLRNDHPEKWEVLRNTAVLICDELFQENKRDKTKMAFDLRRIYAL